MLVIRTGIHIMLVRIGNRDDPAQAASLEAVCTRGYKTFFMLNSVEHEIYPAHKC